MAEQRGFWSSWQERLSALRNTPPVLKIVWQSGPGVVIFGLVARLFAALLPLALLWIPFHFLLFLAPTSRWAVLWLAPACIFAAAPFGIAPAAIQQMMPASMRGQASAVYLFILNLIGLGIGPSAVAICTQYLFRRDAAVNYSLLLVSVAGCLLSAALLASGLKPFLNSLDRLRNWTPDSTPERG